MRKRISDYNKILPVLEVYRCVQSEGSRFGRPTIAVRTTGCTHRCYFGEGGWCDSWYTSIHPEKGTFSFNDIIKIYDENPQVKEMMLTGGSPTMHPTLINELTHFANERNILITIETEGSHYIETDFPLGLISLSPKFSNSVPVIGAITPGGKTVDERMIKTHNRLRLNKESMKKILLLPLKLKDLIILKLIIPFLFFLFLLSLVIPCLFLGLLLLVEKLLMKSSSLFTIGKDLTEILFGK